MLLLLIRPLCGRAAAGPFDDIMCQSGARFSLVLVVTFNKRKKNLSGAEPQSNSGRPLRAVQMEAFQQIRIHVLYSAIAHVLSTASNFSALCASLLSDPCPSKLFIPLPPLLPFTAFSSHSSYLSALSSFH